jgi:hypothetical protein
MPNGVSTVFPGDPKQRLGVPDPTQWAIFFEDFTGSNGATTALSSGTANGWAAVGGVGTPLGVQVSDAANGTNGLFKLTTSAGATDSTTLQRHATLGQAFTINYNRKFYMEIRFQLDSATLSDFGFGLVPASTSSLLSSQTDGLRIGKTTAVSTFQMDAFVGSTTPAKTTSTLFNSAALIVSTQTTLGIAYQGVAYGPGNYGPGGTYISTLSYEFVAYCDLNDGNGVRTQSVLLTAAQLPASTVGLMPSVSYLNTSAVARNATIDYILVAQERFNA